MLSWLRFSRPRREAHTVAIAVDGRPIRLDELSIRNVLIRIDPLCASADDLRVHVPAADVIAALDDRITPIHRPLPNRLASAPRPDRAALAQLRALALRTQALDPTATLSIRVPAPVAGWIRLRYDQADRLMAEIGHC